MSKAASSMHAVGGSGRLMAHAHVLGLSTSAFTHAHPRRNGKCAKTSTTYIQVCVLDLLSCVDRGVPRGALQGQRVTSNLEHCWCEAPWCGVRVRVRGRAAAPIRPARTRLHPHRTHLSL